MSPEGDKRPAPSEETAVGLEIKAGDTPTEVVEKIRNEDGCLDNTNLGC